MDNRKIRFSAVGDLTFGDHPLCVGLGAFSRFRSADPLFPFRQSLGVLQRADLLLGNLECTHSALGRRRMSYHSVQMRGESRMLDALPAAGFHVLNVANNHSMQHGEAAFRETVAMLRQRGLECCGLAADATATRAQPVVVRRNDVAVGFLGYSLRPRQYFEQVPLYAEGRPDDMVRDVEQLRRQTDAVVVSVHWGEEFIQEPAPEEVRLARRLTDAGATLVIGHHPHVLRGIEQRGASCIAYSLGNFVCDMSWDPTLRTSLIFECDLSLAGVENVELVPVLINEDFQPQVLAGPAAAEVLQQIAALSDRIAATPPGKDAVADSDYSLRADKLQRAIRAKAQRYFLSKFWQYPKPMLVQQLTTYFRNRIHERVAGD